MRDFNQDGEHIWLRQSVTFTADGQTRTLEIAIPLRPGATVEEVERLLAEADAGMERLTQHLDARVSQQRMPRVEAAPAAQVPETRAVAEPARSVSDAPAQPSAPASSAQPPVPSRITTPTRSQTPAASPAARGAAPERQSAAPARSAAPPPAAPDSEPRAEMTRPEFIAEIGQMGLDVKQAMARLGVRSLQGLNLREAIETLRRQVLQEGHPAAEPEPALPPPAQVSAPARYFEEEDDEPEFTFTVDGDEGLPEELDAGGASDTLDEVEELDLDDVPDFAPPSAAAPSRRSAGPRETPATTRSARQAPPAAEPPAAGETALSRAQQLIAQLRGAHGGGTPTNYQRASYKNVVANELGDDAIALVRGLWRVEPERLGPEQLDALVSWGKRDTFGEEAAEVLAALRAERAAQSRANKAASARGRASTGS